MPSELTTKYLQTSCHAVPAQDSAITSLCRRRRAWDLITRKTLNLSKSFLCSQDTCMLQPAQLAFCLLIDCFWINVKWASTPYCKVQVVSRHFGMEFLHFRRGLNKPCICTHCTRDPGPASPRKHQTTAYSSARRTLRVLCVSSHAMLTKHKSTHHHQPHILSIRSTWNAFMLHWELVRLPEKNHRQNSLR